MRPVSEVFLLKKYALPEKLACLVQRSDNNFFSSDGARLSRNRIERL